MAVSLSKSRERIELSGAYTRYIIRSEGSENVPFTVSQAYELNGGKPLVNLGTVCR